MKRFLALVIIITFLATGLVGCTSMNSMNNTQRGALYGGTLGALGGAIIGNNLKHKHTGSVRNGAILGGLAGAAGGALIGHQMDHPRTTY